ncbi:MAG: hypothetical protein C5B50_14825 [Verrucomicrobia bacterium]|nr:MAG: hypothetical protein C5B50_14825 [Verrucomicrobiota bacterium]
MWKGLLFGALAALLMAGAFHLWPLPLWVPVAALVAPFVAMAFGLIVGGWRKPSLKEVARWVDNKQQLKERLSTALEIAAEEAGPASGAHGQAVRAPSGWSDLVVTDAAAHSKALDPRKLLPLSLPGAARWAFLLLALCVGLGFVPEYRSKSYLQKQKEQKSIKEAGKNLAELVRRDIEKRPTALPPTQKAMQAVGELGDRFTKTSLTRTEALKDLANVAEKLKEQIKEMAKDPALNKLEQAARGTSPNDTQTAGGLQKQIESLQKQLGSPTGNPEALDKLKKDLQKVQQAAKDLADKGAAAGEGEKQKLSEALSALSKEAQQMGMQMPQLEDAIKALENSQPDQFLKDIQTAVKDLDKMKDMAKSLQQLQQQMDKLGKDLAEQLQKGQPEQAQQTLTKMVEQLKSSGLTQEQLQKMMEEVSKAIPPAGHYGDVAKDLQQACKQGQAGDKSGAAQSLASAAKKLGELAQQMGDAQELMATLDAMNKAAMCISECKGWGQCNNPGSGPTKGSGLGGGVGTWAEEGHTWDGVQNDAWDNTGAVRPNVDPRGHTDRPTSPTDKLMPTKVKGQFSPGAPMPSITLRGVSIKGQSNIAYEEAAAAAQSDAQSALTEEKVPRAYQGAVKDYFDDLKK